MEKRAREIHPLPQLGPGSNEEVGATRAGGWRRGSLRRRRWGQGGGTREVGECCGGDERRGGLFVGEVRRWREGSAVVVAGELGGVPLMALGRLRVSAARFAAAT